MANDLVSHNETSIKTLSYRAHTASELANTSRCQKGGVPRKDMEVP